jgi:hypothetical protein
MDALCRHLHQAHGDLRLTARQAATPFQVVQPKVSTMRSNKGLAPLPLARPAKRQEGGEIIMNRPPPIESQSPAGKKRESPGQSMKR